MNPSEIRDDDWIRETLRSLPTPLPPDLDRRVSRRLRRAAAGSLRPAPLRRRRLAAAAATSLALAVLLLLITGNPHGGTDNPGPRPPIQTRFFIPGKNIQIVWMQRQDFILPATQGE